MPRQEAPSFVAGGKQAYFDRIEWIIIPDPSTAAAAIQSGEAEWWQSPTVDLLPLLRKARNVVVERLDDYGTIGVMRFDMLHPPFDNVRLRWAILPALDQTEFMDAAMGGDKELSRTGVGVFAPGPPLANTASAFDAFCAPGRDDRNGRFGRWTQAAQSDLLGKRRAMGRIVRRHHGIVVRQAPLRAVVVGRHVIAGLQMPLEHLHPDTVFQADQVVGKHRLLHRDGRDQSCGGLSFDLSRGRQER